MKGRNISRCLDYLQELKRLSALLFEELQPYSMRLDEKEILLASEEGLPVFHHLKK